MVDIGGDIMGSIMMRALLLGLALAVSGVPAAEADSKGVIDAKVKSALSVFYSEVGAGKELAEKASGVLVFPEVFKAGVAVGGEYGEGALLIKGKTVAYFNIVGGSVGFQFGAQVKSEVILFMTPKALENFRDSHGWKAGVDGSIAVINIGAGDEIDVIARKEPIIGFIFSNRGLMYNLTFEGAKITRLHK